VGNQGEIMSYQLTIDAKPGYLHAVVTGTNSPENVSSYLGEVHRECTARGCRRVLVEERMEGPRVSLVDVFQVASEGSRQALGFFEAFAYVDVNAVGDSMQFAETVATNRGMHVRVFPTVAEAEAWLLSLNRGGADA
jgi:hypothetical protein